MLLSDRAAPSMSCRHTRRAFRSFRSPLPAGADVKHLQIFTFAACLALTPAAHASEVVIGFGAVEFNSNLAPNDRQFTFEYRFDPYREWDKGQISWGVAVVGHAAGDVWAGAGLVAQRQLGGRWFAEASLMPGLYFENGPTTALGHTIEFRSVLAVGYEITETSSISLAIDHRSNGGLSEFNPGSNGLSLRFHHKF